MRIVGEYPFNGGLEAVTQNYPDLLAEIRRIVGQVDAHKAKTKKSKEITMKGKMLYAPKVLNALFKNVFFDNGWKPVREKCEYPTEYYVDGYTPKPLGTTYLIPQT